MPETVGPRSVNGLVARTLLVGVGALVLLSLLPAGARAFDDCSAGGYFGAVDERMADVASDCREAARFTITTPKGPRDVRIVHGAGRPPTNLALLVGQTRRGIERSATVLGLVGTLAPDDITIWLSHLPTLPEMGAEPEEGQTQAEGETQAVDDGCLIGVHPAAAARRGLAFTTAHEFFHCVQWAETPDKMRHEDGTWWIEGTAEWFGNLAFPATGNSDGYVADFDAVSSDTALTSMEYESVVFFFWLTHRRGPGAVADIMRAMPPGGGEGAQQNTLAGYLAEEDWQHFAEDYLAEELHQPGGRPVASSPFPGDIHVWEGERTHTISADRFVLARAQLEFACGVWAVETQDEHGTRSVREGRDEWMELPERIVADGGTAKRYQMAGFGTGSQGFSVTIEGRRNRCMGCLQEEAPEAMAEDDPGQCLIGSWELVSGGYGKQIEQRLRETGIFESFDYPDLHRYLTLRAGGTYTQGPGPDGEEGRSSLRTDEGKLWHGISNLKMETGGMWAASGDILSLCEERKSVQIDLTIVEPDGDESRMIDSSEDSAPEPLRRQRRFVCGGGSLSLQESLAPTVTWDYRRVD